MAESSSVPRRQMQLLCHVHKSLQVPQVCERANTGNSIYNASEARCNCKEEKDVDTDGDRDQIEGGNGDAN